VSIILTLQCEELRNSVMKYTRHRPIHIPAELVQTREKLWVLRSINLFIIVGTSKNCHRSGSSIVLQEKMEQNRLTRHNWPPLYRSYGVSPSYKFVPKSFRTGRLERELQMVQLSTTRCSCIAILWVSLVSFAVITLCIASQRVTTPKVCIYYITGSVRKLLDTSSYFR
jgi:hypothetical protein